MHLLNVIAMSQNLCIYCEKSHSTTSSMVPAKGGNTTTQLQYYHPQATSLITTKQYTNNKNVASGELLLQSSINGQINKTVDVESHHRMATTTQTLQSPTTVDVNESHKDININININNKSNNYLDIISNVKEVEEEEEEEEVAANAKRLEAMKNVDDGWMHKLLDRMHFQRLQHQHHQQINHQQQQKQHHQHNLAAATTTTTTTTIIPDNKVITESFELTSNQLGGGVFCCLLCRQTNCSNTYCLNTDCINNHESNDRNLINPQSSFNNNTGNTPVGSSSSPLLVHPALQQSTPLVVDALIPQQKLSATTTHRHHHHHQRLRKRSTLLRGQHLAKLGNLKYCTNKSSQLFTAAAPLSRLFGNNDDDNNHSPSRITTTTTTKAPTHITGCTSTNNWMHVQRNEQHQWQQQQPQHYATTSKAFSSATKPPFSIIHHNDAAPTTTTAIPLTQCNAPTTTITLTPHPPTATTTQSVISNRNSRCGVLLLIIKRFLLLSSFITTFCAILQWRPSSATTAAHNTFTTTTTPSDYKMWWQKFHNKCQHLSSSILMLRLSCYLLLVVLFVLQCTTCGGGGGSHGWGVAAIELSPSATPPPPRTNGTVCGVLDIRNSPQQLSLLTNCTVVEGHLQITLMDRFTEADFSNYSFPNLVEVTDYILLYRVNGLKSIGQLFPNLSVIRGRELFDDYALILYELMNLQEIALKSLTYIGRGNVRIEKNPMLCFADTIDWRHISNDTSTGDDANYVKHNKLSNECPRCPDEKKMSNGVMMPTCPILHHSPRCWNRHNCQRVCPDNCKNRPCTDSGECCHEACLGGCSGPLSSDCFVCRDFAVGEGSNRKCTSTCPANTFIHMERRCVTALQCQNMAIQTRTSVEYPFIPHNGKCIKVCPVKFMESGTGRNRTCQPCVGQCKKSCLGGKIESISTAQVFRGCNHIHGPLQIQLRAQATVSIVHELENALSEVEEVDQYIKIMRSFPLLSLSFLKNLKIVNGLTLESGMYAVHIVDNQNLQDLWPETTNVTILRGKVFFSMNPRLCYSRIERILPYVVETPKILDEATAKESNGDKVPCNIKPLYANVTKITASAVVVTINPIKYEDDRILLGYIIYYAIAPYRNVSMYEGRDACGLDTWEMIDVAQKSSGVIFGVITRLEAYTQYAYYVKTYTIAKAEFGGQSELKYFVTSPAQPDPVSKLTAIPISPNKIRVEWKRPKKINGELLSYIIKVTIVFDDPALLSQRDYCKEPITVVPDPVTSPTEEEVEARNDKSCPCLTKKTEHDLTKNGDEAERAIHFQNKLQNTIYIKRVEQTNRRKRSVMISGNDTLSTGVYQFGHKLPDRIDSEGSENTPLEEKANRMVGEFFEFVYMDVNASTTQVVLDHLRHYAAYSIAVKACRKRDNDSNNCSLESIVSQRTLKSEQADLITNVNVLEEKSNTSSSVRVTWTAPPLPNSLVLTYTIRYIRNDLDHAKKTDLCITTREFANQSGNYFIPNLETGNYSIQVMASSLAGDSNNFTAPVYIAIAAAKNNSWVYGLVAVVILIGLVGTLFYYVLDKSRRPVSDLKLIATVNPEYVGMQYQPDEWEVPREKIIQLRELGQGSFGMVYEGLVEHLNKSNDEKRCAIKTVNENATDRERIDFLKEASVMKSFDTHHVVRLLGVVSRTQPTIVIMELMVNGDLKGYLRSHRPDFENLTPGQPPPQPPTLRRILQMAIEIADGMAYLSAKKFVHRDLAARNCMVAEDLTVKIGDFGMTRDIYETDYYRKGTKGLLPVRWMSPESLKDGVFTSYSDVFSYGVVLWEMATLASQPYQGLSNDQVLRYVIDGGVMERPENCPGKLYELMRNCWEHRPTGRPSFLVIVKSLLDDAAPHFSSVSFYHSDYGKDILRQQETPPQQSDESTPLRAEEEDSMDVKDNFMNSQLVPDGPVPMLRPATHSPPSIRLLPINKASDALSSNSTTPPQQRAPLTSVLTTKTRNVFLRAPLLRLRDAIFRPNQQHQPNARNNTTAVSFSTTSHDGLPLAYNTTPLAIADTNSIGSSTNGGRGGYMTPPPVPTTITMHDTPSPHRCPPNVAQCARCAAFTDLWICGNPALAAGYTYNPMAGVSYTDVAAIEIESLCDDDDDHDDDDDDNDNNSQRGRGSNVDDEDDDDDELDDVESCMQGGREQRRLLQPLDANPSVPQIISSTPPHSITGAIKSGGGDESMSYGDEVRQRKPPHGNGFVVRQSNAQQPSGDRKQMHRKSLNQECELTSC